MSERIKSSLRLRADLINKAREVAKEKLGRADRWREIVEEAMTQYFTVELRETDISVLLSKTEQALFDRLYDKIEREFTDMTKRTVNRVGNLVAVSSYDTALTAIMVEELFKKNHASMYGEARKLAAQRMKKRWSKEGADEVQIMVSEKAEAENESRRLRAQVEQLENQVRQYHQALEKAKRMVLDQQQASKQAEDMRATYGEVIHWTRGLLEHLERASMLTSPNKALEEYKKKHPRPGVL